MVAHTIVVTHQRDVFDLIGPFNSAVTVCLGPDHVFGGDGGCCYGLFARRCLGGLHYCARPGQGHCRGGRSVLRVYKNETTLKGFVDHWVFVNISKVQSMDPMARKSSCAGHNKRVIATEGGVMWGGRIVKHSQATRTSNTSAPTTVPIGSYNSSNVRATKGSGR